MTSRPRLLVLNQYYRPGVEASGRLLADLCAALADDFDVTVVTGSQPDAPASRETLDGVSIVRVKSTTFGRRRLWLRGVNYVTFLVQSLVAGLRSDRPDVVLAMTDPPVVANVALVVASRRGAPVVVVCQDVFPETAVVLDQLRNRATVLVLQALVRRYLRRADKIVAIGETMRARLVAKGAPERRITVIPNWVDVDAVIPEARDNEWARSHGLSGRFVVMHSGNVGHAQDLDSLMGAGTLLSDIDDLTIAIVGGGARHAELVGLAGSLGLGSVRFLPHQPPERLSTTLSSADLHVVGLARGLAGYVVPSRLYGVLAAGRPVIAAADAESETAQIVARVGCGVVVPPGNPQALAAAIRTARDGGYDLAAMGAAGREYVVAYGNRSVAVDRYRAVLREVASRP